jgi:hypothetical protein
LSWCHDWADVNEDDGSLTDRNSSNDTSDYYDVSDHNDVSHRDNTSDGNSASDFDEVDACINYAGLMHSGASADDDLVLGNSTVDVVLVGGASADNALRVVSDNNSKLNIPSAPSVLKEETL